MSEQLKPGEPGKESKTLFPLGKVQMTPGAREVLSAEIAKGYINIVIDLLRRHCTGDWSEMEQEDQEENRFSVANDCRVFSAYKLSDDTKIWVITEWDRSYTTLLLPEEY